MSQISTQSSPDAAMDDHAYQAVLDRLATEPALADDNITLTSAEAAGVSRLLLGLGVVGLVIAAGGFALNFRAGFAAMQIGLFAVTAIALGALFFVLVFHITNAGWCATIRRQFENVASLLPLCMIGVAVLLVVELATGGTLLRWLGTDYEGHHLMVHKEGYLNPTFLVIRFLIYAGIWTFLTFRMRGWSTEQDQSGDRWLTRRMRFNSGWGILAFALTTAFFAFDFLMGMDFRFFSTMWGVYFFAACAFSSLAFLAIVFAWLMSKGKLQGVVTSEHLHDHGKLMFAFTVFWGYIAFSQYFLIWYSNIPEETMFYIFRRTGDWALLSKVLIAVHFLIPFFLLVSRMPKRNPRFIAAIGAFMLFGHAIDMTFIIQPMVDAGEEKVIGLSSWWAIAGGVLGFIGIFGFLLLRKMVAVPLTATKDPRLPLALNHKNYV